MSLEWIGPRRCEAGHCPEVKVEQDRVSIRSTMDPDKVTVFSGQEWLHLVAEMRSEHPFGVTADRFGYE